jgi:hypothetical protein
MEYHKFENLLNQITSINKRYSKINELTGENFNVFRIIKLESAEVRMHSAFLAELLNPNGSHGQKDIFLKLFVDIFCYRGNNIDTVSCNVVVEKYIGPLNIEKSEGGKIDILVTDKHGNQIVIENKIYAGDQKNQVLRYSKHNSKADLIYLSLDGKEPEVYSSVHLKSGEDYQCCSYTTHITKWLELCRQHVAILPIIRESITQYLNLVKYLTNQTLNDSMKDEIANLLSNNLEASFIIYDNLDNAINVVLKKFYSQLEVVATELDLEFGQNIDFRFKINYRGFWFWKKNWSHVSINFQFHSYDQNLVYGFSANEDENKPNYPVVIPTVLKANLKQLSNTNYKENDWWACQFKFEEPYANWSKYEAWKAVEDGTMVKLFKEKLQDLIKQSEHLDL